MDQQTTGPSKKENLSRSTAGEENGSSSGKAVPSKPAPFVQPLYVSKLNTVAQILLVASCITASSHAWPPQEVILGLGGVTGGLTIASGLAYWQKHRQKDNT